MARGRSYIRPVCGGEKELWVTLPRTEVLMMMMKKKIMMMKIIMIAVAVRKWCLGLYMEEIWAKRSKLTHALYK